MKYFYSLILTGLMIHLLPLNAEIIQTENTLPSISSGFIASKEEAPLNFLDKELSLLDEEFEEFKDELLSIEKIIPEKEDTITGSNENTTPLIQQLKAEPEKIIAIEMIAPSSKILPENHLVAEEDFDDKMDVAFREELNETEDSAIQHIQIIL